AFEGDVAGFFTLQNARHHAAGLFAEIAVVDAHRSDRATHHAVGAGGDEGHLGVDTNLHQRLVGRHHVVVGVGVDDIDLAVQTAGGGTGVDRTRRGGFGQRHALLRQQFAHGLHNHHRVGFARVVHHADALGVGHHLLDELDLALEREAV